MSKLLNWLRCKFVGHDIEYIPTTLIYTFVPRKDELEIPGLDEIMEMGRRRTIFRKCKRCNYEKEVGR